MRIKPDRHGSVIYFFETVDVETKRAGIRLTDQLAVDPDRIITNTGDLEVITAKTIGVEFKIDGVAGGVCLVVVDVDVGDHYFPIGGQVVDGDALA